MSKKDKIVIILTSICLAVLISQMIYYIGYAVKYKVRFETVDTRMVTIEDRLDNIEDRVDVIEKGLS